MGQIRGYDRNQVLIGTLYRHIILIDAMESFRNARCPSKGNDIVQTFPKGER